MSHGRDRQQIEVPSLSIEWVCTTERPPSPNGKSPHLNIVDLFCGCGGLTLGAWEAARRNGRQLKVQLAIDSSLAALEVYRANFAKHCKFVRADDVSRLFVSKRASLLTSVEAYWKGRLKPVDLILAGPPCQGHSDLNNATRRNDPRNTLYLRVIRAVEILRPKAVIIENVPAVLLDQHEVVPLAIKWLGKLGYHVDHKVVSLANFGIPQLRKRHVLVGVAKDSFSIDAIAPSRNSETPTAGVFLAGLEDEPQHLEGAYYKPSVMSPTNKNRVEYLFKNDIYDLPNALRPSCHRDKKHAYVSMYGRMRWDKPAQTLTSGFGSMGQGRYVHPTRPRLLTPHEAARLQGFPDFFDFTAAPNVTSLREMIANAVPPQFTTVLVDHLITKGLL